MCNNGGGGGFFLDSFESAHKNGYFAGKRKFCFTKCDFEQKFFPGPTHISPIQSRIHQGKGGDEPFN